ncbi:hypothetical protein [Methyloterricola oryzae]|uniref:hypothetical protein n=1 Tax=Methyloterricola oryzae TaxID=1495050 RepID=UPI0005EAED62|nr:hypothetical protein [Methyloterricola oryzae]
MEGELRVGDAIMRLAADQVGLNVLALGPNSRQQGIIEKVFSIPALSDAWWESLEKKRSL